MVEPLESVLPKKSNVIRDPQIVVRGFYSRYSISGRRNTDSLIVPGGYEIEASDVGCSVSKLLSVQVA